MHRAVCTAVITVASTLSLACSLTRAQQEAPPEPAARRPGLTMYIYEVEDRLRQLQTVVPGQTPNVSMYIDKLDLKSDADFGNAKDPFVDQAFGFLDIKEAGSYEFELTSDDGSMLLIDNNEVINNDGAHSAEIPVKGKFDLKAGVHRIQVYHFDTVADQQLTLKWKTPGSDKLVVVPTEAFFTQASVVHVTSPGKKSLIAPLPNTRPGDGEPLLLVHPSFTLSDIHHEGFEPKIGGIDFLPDGRLVCSTWDPHGDVFIVDTKTHEAKRFATGLAEPLGVKVVDGNIYVLQKQELTELIDHDGDGVADEYRCISNRWPVSANFHEFAFGLVYKDGYFYANLAVAINPGGRTTKPQIHADPITGVDRGQCVRIDPKTGEVASMVQGLRAPNGITLMSNGDILITDNQGDWLPSSKLMKVVEGRFYNEHLVPDQPWSDRPVSPPIVWFPQGEIGNSPTQPIECKVGPWKGQVLNGDVTLGGLQRTFRETIDTDKGPDNQGCVFRFTQGFNGGVNRVAWGPDNALYVGEIGSTGNWGQDGKQKFGLQRLEYNGAPSFEILAVRAQTNGFELEFTEPLPDDGVASEPTHYAVDQWRYEPVDTYGGPKVDQEDLVVKSATLSSDRKRVFLEIEGLKEGHVVHIHAADILRNEKNEKLWTTEGWYTLNAIPKDKPGKVGPSHVNNVLTDAETADGWKLLFDGKSLDQWRGFKTDTTPSGWKIVGDILDRGTGGGDLVSRQEYGDFEFSCEWKISPGGNSGVIWRAGEDENPGWRTGPEMQILDNKRHPDGRLSLTSAGSAYAVVAPSRDASLAPNRWNTARIIARGPKIQYFLNNEEVTDFDLSSDDWKARVAASKFKSMPNYSKLPKGHIMLQDHGDEVSFRNVKIRELK